MTFSPPLPALLPKPEGVGLALGAGGARGLAHIVVLEALDELGVKPVAIAGCSMGAVIGAAYAAGVSGKDLRAHTLGVVRNRAKFMSQLLRARVGRFSDLFTGLGANPVLIDGEKLLDLVWPTQVPDRFEQLDIPFTAVATDFHGRREAVFATGPLAPAVAGSMAIAGLVKPVSADGMFLIDGGVTNPLPYRALAGRAAVVIACDVTRGPMVASHLSPKPFEAMFGAGQIVQSAITSEMLKTDAPDILLIPKVQAFRTLDFFRAIKILEAAEHLREDVKRALGEKLERA